MRCSPFLFCSALLLCSHWTVTAQWITQTIQLRPGWNAVFLEVQPEPRECDGILAGLPVESVWRWNRHFTSVQFIQDPNELINEPEAWLAWVSPSHPLAGRSSLYILEGGLPYLIKTTNATTVNWPVRGRPVQRKIEWLPDSLNFVGFGLPAAGLPSFQSFFAGASGLTNLSVFRLDPQGRWISTPISSPIQRGEAFWIRAQGLPTFQGPLEVQLDRRAGLDLGRTLTETTFRIHNASASARTVVVRELTSEAPPSSAHPAVAGAVPLFYWQNDFARTNVGWTSLPSQLQSNVPPDGTWELRLEVRRTQMTPYSPPPGMHSALYQSLLEVSDLSGLSRQFVAVSAEGMQSFSSGGTGAGGVFGVAAASPPSPPDPRAGLWIGNASITNVSQPAAMDPDQPAPTGMEFSFRILVHVDSAGRGSLLQKVLQMWKTGSYKPAADGTTNQVVDQPGRFVLVTDDRLIPQFNGAAIRDGAQVGRRFSSAAFSFRAPIALSATADFGSSGARWSCPVVLDYRDPLNPFVHRFHPDHNNLDERFEQILPEGQESFTVTRVVELEFTANDPNNLALGGWGDTQLGGIYRETITGLHKSPIHISGTFRLHHASRVGALNDGI